MNARAWCEVDLGAVRHNLEQLHRASGVPLLPMVKADAYGIGAQAVAAMMAGLSGPLAPWALGVATLEEGQELRTDGWTGRILCCTPVLAADLPAMAQARITPSLHRADDILLWKSLGNLPWHLSIDTGMNRAGASWREVESLRHIVASHAPEGVFTHYHTSTDCDSREVQEQRFSNAISQLKLPPGTLRHAPNSHAIAHVAPRPVHQWDLARPGIALYGSPAESILNLRPVLHVYARVIDVRDVMPGDTVSYDATWTATQHARIATVAIGHGDGYRRAFSGAGEMLVRGRRARVVGIVTMDMTMLNVSNLPCDVGDVVTVVGEDRSGASEHPATTLTVDEVAAMGGLSPYEFLVGWRLRLPRVYRGFT